jgi:GT2 family glycosyltransferase/Tfp pilus assembly protein PilF
MNISIVIVSYNSSKSIGECLRSIKNYAAEAEIIVVDNNSQDDTVAKIDGVKLFKLAKNNGFAFACSIGAKEATRDNLLFLNPDCNITRNALEKMLEVLDSSVSIGAVGPLSNFAAGWQNLGYYECPLVEHGNDPKFAQRIADGLPRYSEKKNVKLLIGFCLLISKDLYDDIGGMDVNLPLGMDDLDLSWRLRLVGKELRVATNAFVYHYGQVSFNHTSSHEVETLQHLSRVNFSQKLITHYGSVEAVPDSWELWEIDWFELTHTKVKDVPAILLFIENEEKGKAVYKSIKKWVPQPEIVVCNISAEYLSYADDVVWQIPRSITWKDIFQKGKSWLNSERIILYNSLLELDEVVWQDICQSLDIGLVQTDEDFELDLEQKISDGFSGIAVVHEKQKQYAKHQKWFAIHSNQNITPEIKSDLPQEINEFIAQSQTQTGLYHRGKVQDFSGVELSLHNCDALVYRLEIGDIFGFHRVLKAHRKAGVIQFLFLFDNGEFQTQDSFQSQKGIYLPDLKKEIGLGGLAIGDIAPYHAIEQNHEERLFNVQIEDDEWTEEEKWRSSVSQFKIRATVLKESHQLEQVVSIVILALNKIEYTKKCIESIQKYCKQAYELILVDNGSTDETFTYFSSIPGAIVIRNDNNLGVSAGWNQGLKKAKGDFALILNNDTILGPNTIENLVRCSNNHPNVGVVAPLSNNIAGPQKIEGFNYSDENEIPHLIESIQKQQDLESWSFQRIKGFCMLIPMPVVKDVGLFDEVYGLGNFEDDDYSLRLFYKGYDLRIAHDSFIFHYGSVSFSQANIDWQMQMQKNHQIFNEKWKLGRKTMLIDEQVEQAEQKSSSIDVWQIMADGNLQEAASIFLENLNGDFEDSENYYGLGLISYQQKNSKDAFGFFCRSIEIKPSNKVAQAIVDLLSEFYSISDSKNVLQVLIKKYPDLSPLQKSLEEMNCGEISKNWAEDAEVLISNRDIKAAQNLLNKVAETGENGFQLNNYQGLVHYYEGFLDKAFTSFSIALKENPTDLDALLNFYDVGLKINAVEKVLDVFEYSLSIDSTMEEARRCFEELKHASQFKNVYAEKLILSREQNISIENLIREGMLEKAIAEIDVVLGRDATNFRSINNLGLISWYQGNIEEAYSCFKESIQKNIWYTDAIINFYDCCILLKKLEEFKPILNKAISLSPRNRDLLKIRSEMLNQKTPDRLEKYNIGSTQTIIRKQLIKESTEKLEQGDYANAIIGFCNVLDEDPDNVEAINGVGIAAYYKGDYQDAFRLFLKSVQLKPIDKDSLLNLWDAANKLKIKDQVKPVLENAVSVDPTLVEIQHCIETYNATLWN